MYTGRFFYVKKRSSESFVLKRIRLIGYYLTVVILRGVVKKFYEKEIDTYEIDRAISGSFNNNYDFFIGYDY